MSCRSILCVLLRVKPPTIFQLWRASFSIAFIAVHIQRHMRVSIHAWYYEQFYSYYRVTARIDANTFDQICVHMMLKYSISFFSPLYTIPMFNIHGIFCKEASASTAEAAVIFFFELLLLLLWIANQWYQLTHSSYAHHKITTKSQTFHNQKLLNYFHV